MPTTITGNPATSHGSPISFSAPSDGETANAASVDSPYQAIADVVARQQAHAPDLSGTNAFTGANDFTGGTVAVAVAASAAQPVRKDTFDAAVADNSASSGSINTSITTTTYADVPGASATIVTRGRSVMVFLGAGPVASGPSLITTNVVGGVSNAYRILRDGTAITGDIILSAFSGDTDVEIPPPGFIMRDATPTAASHVYKLQWKVNANSTLLSNLALSVVEV